MTDISVLIIDDERSVLTAISSVLKHEGITSHCVQTSREGFELLTQNTFDLILLDIMMPEQDGFSFLQELRERQILTPVILLSGREEDAAQVKGLGLGADDYMTKPFSKTVLVSKIKAIVRRNSQYASAHTPQTTIPTSATLGEFTLEFDSQVVYKGSRKIALSSKEFSLLCFFLEHPKQIFSKQEIFTNVWKSDTPDDNSILVYIKRLRDKIEENPSKPVHLLTVWGKGYQFVP